MDGVKRMSKRKKAMASPNACTVHFLIFVGELMKMGEKKENELESERGE